MCVYSYYAYGMHIYLCIYHDVYVCILRYMYDVVKLHANLCILVS